MRRIEEAELLALLDQNTDQEADEFAQTPVDPLLYEFTEDVFATCPRADQRRSAYAYLWDLVRAGGRGARGGASPGGRAGRHRLRHFLNHSPWHSEHVLRRICDRLLAVSRPYAWVVHEVAVPRLGRNLPGVDRQFVPELGTATNCQIKLVTTAVFEHGSCPVNWRLFLPQSWHADHERRRRARIPDHLGHRPKQRLITDMRDELVEAWGCPSLPLVVDADLGRLEPLLAELLPRDQVFLVRATPSVRVTPLIRAARPVEPLGTPRPNTSWPIRQVVEGIRHLLRSPGGSRNQEAIAVPVQIDTARHISKNPLLLIVSWPEKNNTPDGQPTEPTVWLSNLTAGAAEAALPLLRYASAARDTLTELSKRFPLADCRVRSYRGVDHHLSLFSAAAAYSLLTELA